ncbi:MAG: TlpA family protein disulfide reductase [Sporichthyaceae bacterium]
MSLLARRAAASTLLVVVLGACGDGSKETAGGTEASPAPGAADEQDASPASLLDPCPTPTDAPPVADGLPSILLECLGPGPAVDPATLRGRPTVVNLWASWCGPCRSEMPALRALSERFGDRVQFLGVNTKDDPTSAAEFLQFFDVAYPELRDTRGGLMARLRIPGLPVTVVTDRDGRVAYRKIGEFDQAELTRQIEQLL